MQGHSKFKRQEAFFGRQGQEFIEQTRVAIAGLGGLGSHVAQHLAHLGTSDFILIEPDVLDDTNKNRLIGHRHDDPIPGTSKAQIAKRVILAVNPEANVQILEARLPSAEITQALRSADIVFGCLDNEGARLILNNLAATLSMRYIDAATEILPGDRPRYGGRVFCCWDRPGCIECCDVLDRAEANLDLASTGDLANRALVYGLPPEEGSGPSVVTINGVVAAVAATEFMLGITGVRAPVRLLTYRADMGTMSRATSEPRQDCYTCSLAKADRFAIPLAK